MFQEINQTRTKLVPLRSLRRSFIDSFSFAKKRCNTSCKVLAPFSFSHVIILVPFFISLFVFFLSFSFFFLMIFFKYARYMIFIYSLDHRPNVAFRLSLLLFHLYILAEMFWLPSNFFKCENNLKCQIVKSKWMTSQNKLNKISNVN